MTKGLLIDVEKQTVTQIEIGDYTDIYKKIGNGCTLFAVPVVFDNNDSLYIDDEGLFNELKGGFIMPGWNYPIVGNAVILGCDDEGESVDCKTNAEEIKSQIKFVSQDIVEAYINSINL